VAEKKVARKSQVFSTENLRGVPREAVRFIW
jgi:hypothetical protein